MPGTSVGAHRLDAGRPGPRLATPPVGVDAERLTWAETVRVGAYHQQDLGRGRIDCATSSGAACAHLLLWRADATVGRLNVADTVKGCRGRPTLVPDIRCSAIRGRLLATIVTDDSGHHDALCGTSHSPTVVRSTVRGCIRPALPVGNCSPSRRPRTV